MTNSKTRASIFLVIMLVWLIWNVPFGRAETEWFDPVVVQSCDQFVVKWYDSPTPVGELDGQVWFYLTDGKEQLHYMTYQGDATLAVKIPEDARSVSWGRIWQVDEPSWLGIIHNQDFKCYRVFLGIIERR